MWVASLLTILLIVGTVECLGYAANGQNARPSQGSTFTLQHHIAGRGFGMEQD